MAAGSTYTPIATTTLGSAASSYTFSSIPSTYTDLRIVFNGNYATASRGAFVLNSDTGSNYSNTRMTGDGSTAASARASNAAYVLMGLSDISTTHTYSIDLMNYSNTTTNKTALIRLSDASAYTLTAVGLWRSTSAINSILIKTANTKTFAVGSLFNLYGIAAA